jgi:Lhr-like helicase
LALKKCFQSVIVIAAVVQGMSPLFSQIARLLQKLGFSDHPLKEYSSFEFPLL